MNNLEVLSVNKQNSTNQSGIGSRESERSRSQKRDKSNIHRGPENPMLDKIKELSPPRGSVGGKSHISSRKGNRNHESDMVTHNSRKPIINI